MEKLIGGAKVRMARRVEESKVAERSGARDTAEYLARESGTSIASARDTLNTSRRLVTQPAVEDAVRQGELSTPQATALTDAVAGNPAAALKLVEAAKQSSVGELRDACGRAKAAADPDPEATNRRIHANRYLRFGVDSEGAWTIHGRGTIDAGAEIQAALEPIIDQRFNAARRAGRQQPREAYAFDALVEGAEKIRTGGEPAARRRERNLTLVRVDPRDPHTRRGRRGRALRDHGARAHPRLGRPQAVGRLGAQVGRHPWRRRRQRDSPRPRPVGRPDDRPAVVPARVLRARLPADCPHRERSPTYKGWAFVEGIGKRPMVPPGDPRHPANQANAPPSRAGPDAA